MKHLFKYWEEVKQHLNKIVLLLDYDGTLTPIVERPELAVLSDDMRNLLENLSGTRPVSIISGRSLQGIKKLVGVEGIYYAGNHGFEISGPGAEISNQEAEAFRPIIAQLCDELGNELGKIKGVIVENKGLTASVHYRLVAEHDLGELNRIFEEITERYKEEIRITRGKKVLELRPNVGWGKGRAALWVMEALHLPKDSIPFYLGDDVTDEDAFIALKDKGVTVLVALEPEKSNAEYFLKNVGEVKDFLRRVLVGA